MASARRIPNPLRDAWIQLLSEHEQFEAFMTIGFSMYLDVPRAIHCLNHLLLRLNRSVYSKRFRQHQKWLTGIAILEFKRRSKCSPNGPHFHLLLRGPGPGSLDLARLSQLVDKHAERLRFPTGNQHRPLGRRISGPKYVDVGPINDAVGLAGYVTKELERHPTKCAGITIGFVGADGVVGIERVNGTF